jgi:hypothetical protein
MTIKQQGGIFGRNPTFNNVDVEGTLTVNGEPISDFGTMAQQDADSVNIDGGAIDAVTLGTNSPVTEMQVDNININGNTISSTNTNGSVTIDPNGTGFLDVQLPATAGVAEGLRITNPQNAGTFGDGASIRFQNTPDAGSDRHARIESFSRGAYGQSTSFRFLINNGAAAPRNVFQMLGDTGDVYVTEANLRLSGGGNVIMNSGSGIDFSATSGTGTSELFDDYEEGSWQPVIGGVNTTSIAYYTKIGRVVYLHMDITSGGGASSASDITGLPYTPAIMHGGIQVVYDSVSASSGGLGGYIDTSSPRITIRGNGGASAVNIAAGERIMAFGFYLTS